MSIENTFNIKNKEIQEAEASSGVVGQNIAINQKIDKIRFEIVDSIDKEKIGDFLEDIVIFTEHLREKYPNSNKYRILHNLIGSTVPKSMLGIIEEDFPGEDSIEKFVERLAEKYIKQ